MLLGGTLETTQRVVSSLGTGPFLVPFGDTEPEKA